MKHMRVAGVILMTMVLTGSVPALSQDIGPRQEGQEDGSAPAMAMGSGRMVRGTVSAVAGDKITVKTESGDTFQVALTPNTRVMKGRDPMKASEIKVGDGLGAGGEMDQSTKTLHALFVSVVDAEQVKKMRESLGKTWIQGRVTAIEDLKLTILRGDKVTQVIAVDEDTSFKRGGRGMAMAMQGDGSAPMMGGGPGRSAPGANPNAGGESITLADVKVGDIVAGQGGLKNGVFVPTTLAVVDPSQRHHRQGEAAGAGSEPK